MRLAGQWLYDLQNWDDLPDQFNNPAWLGIGFIVADWGGLLFLLSLALGAIGVRRLRQATKHRPAQGDDGSSHSSSSSPTQSPSGQ